MDPSTGRFNAADPYPGRDRDPTTLHRYMYAAGSPLDRRDPSGLFFASISIGSLISTISSISVVGLVGLVAPSPDLPPTGKELSKHPVVTAELEDAWIDSYPDIPGGELIGMPRHEEGGWIYMNPDTRQVSVERAPPGGQTFIILSIPKLVEDAYVVGNFHTHPNPKEEGFIEGPHDDEIVLEQERGVPGVIRSWAGIHYYGPTRRASFSGSRRYPWD